MINILNILLIKLHNHNYGIKGNYLKLLKSYLDFEKKIKETTFQNTLCEALQGSIFGILLFLIYVNNLCMASSLLTPIMFADDTNLSFFKIRILRNFLIVSEINSRELPPDLKQINYRLTYLKRNICCFILRTKSLKLSTPSSIKN